MPAGLQSHFNQDHNRANLFNLTAAPNLATRCQNKVELSIPSPTIASQRPTPCPTTPDAIAADATLTPGAWGWWPSLLGSGIHIAGQTGQTGHTVGGGAAATTKID